MQTASNMRLEVTQDEYPDNPREDWDHLGHMVCWHPRATLGDEQIDRHSAKEWVQRLAGDAVGARDAGEIPWKHVERILEKHFVILPLYLYEHGGMTMSTGAFADPWDSGQVGFIYVTREQVEKEFAGDRERALECLRAEVKEYDAWLTGDVWCVAVVGEEGEVVDSCCGFYGYDYAMEEGQRMLEAARAA